MYCTTRTNNKRRAVGEIGKFWPNGHTIGVGFIGGTNYQHDYIKKYAVEWERYVNVKFDFTGNDIRVAFAPGDGSWSYVGTDCLDDNKSRDEYYIINIDEGMTTDTKPLPDKKEEE